MQLADIFYYINKIALKFLTIILLVASHSFSNFDYAYPIMAFYAKTGRSRFGDCLSIIYTTKYLSYKYNMPILLEKFNNSDELEIRKVIDSQINKSSCFKNIIKIKNESEIKHCNKDTLFVVDVNFILNNADLNSKATDLANQDFKKIIKPIKPIKQLFKNLSKNLITVAVHVRKGGGYDLPLLSQDGLNYKTGVLKNYTDADKLAIEHKVKPFYYSDVRWPFKFPPDSFYINQILHIYEILDHKAIHVHIFTDDPNPESIMGKYKKFINNPNITFSCREKNNSHDKNIVDDFMQMTTFDCLIRPVSFFSENIQRLGNFKIVIFPKHGIWVKNDMLIIDEAKVIIN